MSEPPGTVRLAASLERRPAGAPVLVLGNSLGTTGELWRPQLAALAARFRLLRYEHRGHGGSPAPPGPYTIAGLGADVLRLLDESGIETAHYCGVSLGGMVGMWLAVNAPDRIGALALCCTSAYLPPAQMWAGRAALVRSAGMASISQQIVGRWFTPAFAARHPGVAAGFVATMERRVVPEGYAGCCEAIAGADDPATPPWYGAAIASAVPGARLRVIRGAAHLANVSQAAEVTAALLAHLAA
jgi:3-oxoadipate enol-lactonase